MEVILEIIFEIVGSLILFVVTEVLLAGLGWLCLFVRYRNRKKMEEIKNRKYKGEYSAAGNVMFLNLITFIARAGAIAFFGMNVILAGFWIYKAIVS
jgi:hypothetical protein